MDWTHPVVVDVVWSRLASWEGVYEFWEGRFVTPLALVCGVRRVCRAFRVPLDALWRAISRPYLANDDIGYANRVLMCEYAARRLVQGLEDRLRQAGIHACVAGGFAAWQLERRMQTDDGTSAFPSTMRGTTFYDGLPRNSVWIPMDIDVFFAGDSDVALPIVQDLYGHFSRRLFGVSGVLSTRTVCSDDYYAGEPEETTPDTLRRMMADAKFPHTIADQAVRAMQRARAGHRVLHKTWRINSYSEPIFATEINVVQIAPPIAGRAYPSWVFDGFDLAHCCVALSVDAGQWRFECAPGAQESLHRRQLRFHTTPGTAGSTAATVRRLIKYFRNGFSFVGS